MEFPRQAHCGRKGSTAIATIRHCTPQVELEHDSRVSIVLRKRPIGYPYLETGRMAMPPQPLATTKVADYEAVATPSPPHDYRQQHTSMVLGRGDLVCRG